MRRLPLGSTGLTVSRLSLGTGTDGWDFQSDQTRALGTAGLARLMRAAWDRGINFFDLADQYGSHPAMREALKAIPRDEAVITTKTTAKSGPDMKKALDRFLKEMGTDYIDILLFHCVTSRDWGRKLKPAMDVLERAKQEGKVRAVGASEHSMPGLAGLAAEPWADVALVRANFGGENMAGKPDEVTAVMRGMMDAGKGVYGMKVLGGGKFKRQVRKAVEWHLSVPEHAFTVGFVSERELDEVAGIVGER
jgi:aryl-alcohol dehydrogenase-like predicted oxidoreductase